MAACARVFPGVITGFEEELQDVFPIGLLLELECALVGLLEGINELGE